MPDSIAALDRAAADIPLTRSARDVLERAVADAAGHSSAEPSAFDVLRALLSSRGSRADEAMRSLGVDPSAVAASLPPDGEAPPLALRQLLVNASREAQVLGHYQVDSIHLLLALLYSDARPTAATLQQAGLTLYDLRRHLQMGATPDTPIDVRPSQKARPPDRSLRRRPWPSLRGVLGVSPLFLGIVAVCVLSGALLWFDALPAGIGPITLTFVFVGWIASVCIHEFFHAVTAYLGGDRDVAVSGYLRIDPLKYTHVAMSIVLPIVALLLGGIGLPGGAVYINNSALRSKTWASVVSLAGPVANTLFALIIGGISLLAFNLDWVTGANAGFFEALSYLGYIEVFAVILNLLPVPPLDGFGILRPWLPYSVQASAARVGMFGFLIVFLVLFYVPAVSGIFYGWTEQITASIGINLYAVTLGLQHARFFQLGSGR
jgi:Zn-dependent protease